MRVLDLFSGIGGFSLGLERAGMETVAFCEFDKKAQLVLKKHWPDVPIYDDVRKLNGKQFEGQAIDLICGGFPCQPFSVAGKQRGKEDDRHLWPEYFRLIQEIRPRWVIGENVPGLINLGLDQVLSDLESENYTVQTFNIPACAVNAPHQRQRCWIIGRKNDAHSHGQGEPNGSKHEEWLQRDVADSESMYAGAKQVHKLNSQRSKNQQGRKTGLRFEFSGGGEDVAHSNSTQCEGGGLPSRTQAEYRHLGGTSWWAVEPNVGRVAHGIPSRVDRLKMKIAIMQLGNAVVPQVVEQIGRAIMEVEAMIDSDKNE